jgi:hypothetical protein
MDIWTVGMVQRLTDDIALCGIWSVRLFCDARGCVPAD